MMKRIGALAVAAAAVVMMAAPASAEWFHDSIAKAKAERGETANNERAARTRTAKKSAPAQVATNTDDDGTRPQRRRETTPRSNNNDNLSGGETGVASYYWQPQALASGGRFDPNAWTAAHKTLPFGTRVRVTRLDNGNSVEVTINDRGPYIAGRIIDLSRRAAQAIDMTGRGVAPVRVTVIGR